MNTPRPLSRLAVASILFLALSVAQLAQGQTFAGDPGGTDSCVPLPPGLVTLWPGDGNADDLARKNNGVLKNGATATAEGLSGQAFSFDGMDSYVVLPNLAASQPEGTVEGWFKLNTWNWSSAFDGRFLWASTEFLPNSGDSWDGAALGTHPGYSHIGGELMFGIESDSGWHWAFSGVTPQTNLWYHVAGSWGANGITVYVNGQSKGSDAYTGPVPDYLNYSLLGRSSWPRSVMDGLIDEFALYNRALSLDEIAAIYAAGGAGKCKAPPASPSLPPLRIIRSGNTAVLTWLASASETILEMTEALPATRWTPVPFLAVPIGAEVAVTVGTDRKAKFFRLRTP